MVKNIHSPKPDVWTASIVPGTEEAMHQTCTMERSSFPQKSFLREVVIGLTPPEGAWLVI